MKVRSNIKAGGQDTQHNEKMMDNNNGSIEREKSFVKKLALKKETIRELKDLQLKGIAGGALNNSFSYCYASGCCKG